MCFIYSFRGNPENDRVRTAMWESHQVSSLFLIVNLKYACIFQWAWYFQKIWCHDAMVQFATLGLAQRQFNAAAVQEVRKKYVMVLLLPHQTIHALYPLHLIFIYFNTSHNFEIITLLMTIITYLGHSSVQRVSAARDTVLRWTQWRGWNPFTCPRQNKVCRFSMWTHSSCWFKISVCVI